MIQVNMKYTKQNYRRFMWFDFFKRGTRKICNITFIAIIFSIGVLSLIGAINRENYTPSVFSIIMMLICLLYPLLVFGIIELFVLRAQKVTPSLFELDMAFTFHDDHFVSTSTGELSTGTAEVKYTALYRVFETKDCFYLYQQMSSSFIIEKSNFTSGTPEELSEILSKALPKKKFVKYT